ncbi:hypothetical protein CDL12_05166 [Handroanthus impetiginosus]|uniref:DUF7086 domain-containing protein n=1 Tax=Handroanthus impetiginosus TaxID=429701 RepID=A0A2G9HXR0_9LAMI|nr:hypothetical protein CDL12_05166 [Handroanthus impetiginosus]
MDKKNVTDGQDSPNNPDNNHRADENDDFLNLSLSSSSNNNHHRHHAPPSPPQQTFSLQPQRRPLITDLPPIPHPDAERILAGVSRMRRPRRTPSTAPGQGKTVTIPPPYPWSTDRRAAVHKLSYLLDKQITTISGDVQCNKCEQIYTMSFDLESKFNEVTSFIVENKPMMHQRAPKLWLSPNYAMCIYCNHQDSVVKPVISPKKRSINWLFMMLGQTLGTCTLEQLKYFCKHTKNHRTGAKDRVLYLTYLTLCRQLDPNGPFDI